jgi:hypothetical protein
MSLISTTVDLGGSYRRFRCPSIYIHKLSPADDCRCPPFLVRGTPMLRLSMAKLNHGTQQLGFLSFLFSWRRKKIQLPKRCNFIEIWTKSKKTISQTENVIHSRLLVGFQILAAASMKMSVSWVVTPCRLVELYRRFIGTCCILYQGDRPEGSHLQ